VSVFGFWFLVLGFWFLVFGSWFLVLGFGFGSEKNEKPRTENLELKT
jgi:hypothetical protein